MIRSLLTVVLAAGAALAQTQNPGTPQGTVGSQPPQTQPSGRPTQQPGILTTLPSAAQPDTAASVPANAPIITLHGACDKSQAGSADCTTVITKEQFEKLIDAVNSNNQPVPPQMRRNLAQALVELTAFSQAAEKVGIPDDAKFQEVMKLVRMRTLADMYRRRVEEKDKNPSQQELEAYYNQNSAKYQEVKMGRIFIPKNPPGGQDKPDFAKKAGELATEIHARAEKGEDLEKLQKEAYTTLGITTPPPSTEAGVRRHGMMLPEEEQEVFALQPGAFTKVEDEPTGFIIYKLESKQSAPLEQVKDEIARELFRQKVEGDMKSVSATVHADLNDQYFGPPPATAPTLGPPGAAPGATGTPKPGSQPSTSKPAGATGSSPSRPKKTPPPQ